MPASGKSSVGRAIASRLSLRFADTDEEIEAEHCQTIKGIFLAHGEQTFRRLESECLAALLCRGSSVVSTGGGVVLRVENRKVLRVHSHVTYLRTQPHQLIQRIRRDGSRPLLDTADPLKTLEELFAVRDPLYLEVADLVVDVHSGSAAKTADRVIAAWRAKGWLVPQSGDESEHPR